nr:glycosyltransferase [Saccharophagus sp. K07]
MRLHPLQTYHEVKAVPSFESSTISNSPRIGAVAIGRNEGDRLVTCLKSLTNLPLVYVDSGSSDNSVNFARSIGAICVELDLSRPFTAARARNTGFRALLEQHPDLEWVMFVDGDCEVEPDWLEKALQIAQSDERIAAVCGRRRERFPESSIYNQMCDIEWNTPVGEAKACGGDALYRVKVFQQVGGFDDSFIAGEEPELCFRIREQGYRILRIDANMTRHDAAISRIGQWWKRTERSGHAFLLNYLKHGQKNAERFNYRDVRSILLWAGIYCAFLLAVLVTASLIPLLLLVLLITSQAAKMTLALPRIKAEYGELATFRYSVFVMLGKVPQALGVIRAYLTSRRGGEHRLVEYK